jgi:choline dehydrogenase-like flavoprotein
LVIDSRALSNNETIETDVCIVGAGIAGISLARELIDQKFRVCLLESGGLRPDKSTQSLFWGENIGHHYYPLDTVHICGFGGSSHRWNIDIGDNALGVRLRPLDEIDFEERDWVPYSGWPFNKAHLNPFYERAQSVCKIGPFTYDVKDWEDTEKTPQLPFLSNRVRTIIYQFGSRDPFISDYRDEITHAGNIDTFTYANVVEIETHETGQSVNRLRVACLKGNKFWVSANLFILALGAIETSRLLLLSNRAQCAGLGNQNDLVGRFFMEHPHLWSGKYLPANPNIFNRTALYRLHKVNNVPIRGELALKEDVIRREKLVNHCLAISPINLTRRQNIAAGWLTTDTPLLTDDSQRALRSKSSYQITTHSRGVDSFRVLSSAIRRGKIPEDFSKHIGNVTTDIDDVAITAYRNVRRRCGNVYSKLKRIKQNTFFRLNHKTEQVPNPNSRITLADERDALGRNRVRLDWQFTPLDIRSIIRAQEIIDEELRQSGLGRLEIELKGETPPPDIHGGWHHMGTTRMNTDPKKGVVDENCQVHGISNLFIAGPSVFPTGGYANPVLTTVALSLRMADYVKECMK